MREIERQTNSLLSCWLSIVLDTTDVYVFFLRKKRSHGNFDKIGFGVLIDVFDWCQKFSSEIPKGPYFTMKATMSTANPRDTKCHLGFVHARIYSPEYFPSTGLRLVLV